MDADEVNPAGNADLVVVGASMGGITALSTLVSTLPAEFPVPLVIAQHLDPRQPSHLLDILSRRTTLPVVLVEGSLAMQPGTIYVVPSNNHVTILDGNVQVMHDWTRRPMPSVDLLLSTAAASYGERLIAVILTGSGSDGSVGGVAVKNSGGIVVVEDPRTARDPSMPSALPPTAVDYVVELERIGPLLHSLVTGGDLPAQTENTAGMLRQILAEVASRANIDFRPYKVSTILRRIGRRMVATGTTSLRDYADHLLGNPEEVRTLVGAFLIKVTQFFRDPEAFEYLRTDILPGLIARARGEDRVLRFWSAGCATGEEPYSLAMLLADMLGADLPNWTIKIFGTDLDNNSIEFARRGLYPENLLENLPDGYRGRFFHEMADGFHVARELRQMVIFGRQDLGRSAAFPRIDMVLCRNLLIYFTPQMQQRVLDLFSYSLRNGGYLFLGRAETTRVARSEFALINKKWKIYRAAGSRAMPAPVREQPGLADRSPARHPMQSGGPLDQGLERDELDTNGPGTVQLRNSHRLLLRFLPYGVVVVDRQYRLQTVNNAARRLLGLIEVGTEVDFLHSARGLPYSRVREAIDRVFREGGAMNLEEVQLESTGAGGGGYVSIAVTQVALEPGTPEMAMLTIADVTAQVQARRAMESMRAEQEGMAAELREANERLNDLNRELTYANEELQVANEEMMMTQEELQAANEEFEATNEELQATNEELETSNEELQASNEELEATNDELIARTQEMQELTNALGAERARLAQIVEIAPFYILVLRGPRLIVEAYNPLFARQFEGREVLGRPLEDVYRSFWESPSASDLLALIREATTGDKIVHTPRVPAALQPGRAAEDEYVSYIIVPSHDAEGQVDGVVIYTYDETQQRAREMAEEGERLRIMFENAPLMALGLYEVESGRLRAASPRYRDILGRAGVVGGNDPIGRTWTELVGPTPVLAGVELFRQVLETREPVHLDETRIEIDGEESIWEVNLVPVPNRHNSEELYYVVLAGIDVTEQVQAREELIRLDRLRDEFLSSASHELRTPLVPLRGYTDLLARMLRDSGDVIARPDGGMILSFIEEIRAALDRLDRLVEDLMNVSRLEQGRVRLERRPVDLAEVVRQVANEARRVPDMPAIDIELPKNEELVLVFGDPVRLHQVLLNLLTNARVHAATSPRVELRLRRLPPADGTGAGRATIEVRDYGPGISPENMARLFTRFYQAGGQQGTGLGLGLYIASELVEMHDGKLTVHSAPGQGSTFTVTLPLATPESVAEGSTAREQAEGADHE